MIVALVGCSLAAMGQKVTQGSLDFMRDVKSMSVVFVFDQATVPDNGNISITEFGGMRDAKDNEKPGSFMYEIKNEAYEMSHEFVRRASSKMKDVRFIWKEGEPYTMTCVLRTVGNRGQHCNSDYIFTNTATGEVLAIVNCECRGGTLGTFTNLMKDSYNDAFGKVIGKMAKAHKK